MSEGFVYSFMWFISGNNIITLEQKLFCPMTKRMARVELKPEPIQHTLRHEDNSETWMIIGGWRTPELVFERTIRSQPGRKCILVTPGSEVIHHDPHVAKQEATDNAAKIKELALEYNVTKVTGYSLGSAFALHLANSLPDQINFIWLLQTGGTITEGMWDSEFGHAVLEKSKEENYTKDDYFTAFEEFEPKHNLNNLKSTTHLFADFGMYDCMINNPIEQTQNFVSALEESQVTSQVFKHEDLGHYGVVEKMHHFASERFAFHEENTLRR